MTEAASVMQYEEAVRWRNLLRSIEVTVEKQKVVLRGGDSDVIGFHREGNRIELAILFLRGGVLTGSALFSLGWELDDATGIGAFLQQYYTAGAIIPDEIFLPLEIDGVAVLVDFFGELKVGKVSITRPLRGTKRELVELACKNAESAIRERDECAASAAAILTELQQRLHLSHLPHRIECYDISTIQGSFSVGSGVVFSGARVDKNNYRRYRIKTVQGQDDFGMLREVFSRRFREESIRKNGLPDLVVVDGGIGQLNAAQEIIFELGLAGRFDLLALAKSRTGPAAGSATVEKSAERVFLPGRKNPVVLRQNSAPLLLLAAIRDEAHRFAIEYHRKLRGKAGIASGIDSIPGVGPKRRIALLSHFGSLQGLWEAKVEEIAGVTGMNRGLAEKLHEVLHDA
jgi:excinuclease ABC subunit C